MTPKQLEAQTVRAFKAWRKGKVRIEYCKINHPNWQPATYWPAWYVDHCYRIAPKRKTK